jgi:hypothetical protein
MAIMAEREGWASIYSARGFGLGFLGKVKRSAAYNAPIWSSCDDQGFKIGDHVRWNSEAGHVSGTIIAVHTSDFDYKGYVHHASPDDPQYEIKSDKSDHIAAHKGGALKYA